VVSLSSDSASRELSRTSALFWQAGVGLFSHRRLKTLFNVLWSSRRPEQGAVKHLELATAWLCRAQEVTGTAGLSYGYGFLEGWWPPYPETTGYCISTFLSYARLTGDEQFLRRAKAMAEWELTVQGHDGGIPGGPLGAVTNRPGVAFDTGQVLQGLVVIYRETGEERFLCAAERAARWLIDHQSADGAWYDRVHGESMIPHAYNARTSWALLDLYDVVRRNEYKEAAQRNLEWTLACQLPSGWFRNTAFMPGDPPLTHTIGYVLEGLLESWCHLRDKRLLQASLRCAEALRDHFDHHNQLPATFDANWESKDHYSCVPGCAQIALAWFRLFEIAGLTQFRQAALRLNRWLASLQIQAGANADAHGGIPGSYPLFGQYERMRLPNWAAKFFADAMLAEYRVCSGSA
jgi:Squalene-hopene cyclase C-terminal domain